MESFSRPATQKESQAFAERHEHDIKLLNDELLQSNQRLAAANCDLESFSYSVAHDLRSPIRQIAGFSKILVEEYGPQLPAEARRYLDKVAQGASRMGALVDDLLHLSQIGKQKLQLQPTLLNEVVRDALQLLQPEYAYRHVEWRIGELGAAVCDQGLMKQAFVNLLSNALKYSRNRNPARIEVGLSIEREQTVVFVRDNGIGFDMQYGDKLFGTFERLHSANEFEGTGIGLATVARIVRKHGGKIWAHAEIDRGATFYMTIQRLLPPAMAS